MTSPRATEHLPHLALLLSLSVYVNIYTYIYTYTYTYLRDVTIARFKEALRKTAAPKYRP